MYSADTISLYFPSIKIFRTFLPKGGRSSAYISNHYGKSAIFNKVYYFQRILSVTWRHYSEAFLPMASLFAR